MIAVCTALCVCSSCSKDKDLFSPDVVNASIDAFTTTKTTSITVPNGQFCIVRIGNDTLAISDESEDVLVPKGITPTIEYVDKSAVDSRSVTYANTLKNGSSCWEVIAFEDSKEGDNDFNDLIVHVQYKISNKNFAMTIHPICYGAKKTINLGYEIYDNKDALLASDLINDTRKSLFFDSGTDFINTSSYQRHYDGYSYKKEISGLSSNSLAQLNIVWYIVVDGGTKIYALNKKLVSEVDMFNATTGYPYSLILSGVSVKGYYQGTISCGFDWFKYPLESVPITACYDIAKWQKNSSSALENYLIDNSKVFDVTKYDEVSQKRIYEISSPPKLITDWDK